jgi:hypothetical protein
MTRRSFTAVAAGLAAVVLVATGPALASVTPGGQVVSGPALATTAAVSTSGDFATDVFGDPWDFSNPADLDVTDEVGTQSANGVSISGGLLNVQTVAGTTIRLLFDWPDVIPWGRDGRINPIDASTYTQTTFRICAPRAGLGFQVRFENDAGSEAVLPFNPPAGCSVQHFDLTYRGYVPGSDFPSQYPTPGYQGFWEGRIIRFEIHRGGVDSAELIQLDWVRVHRANASSSPPSGLPVARVLTPNVEGGVDYATAVRGNPWDFAGLDDVHDTNDIAGLGITAGDLTGATIDNDGWVGLALGPEVNTDRYRRMTIDACYGGTFGLGDVPGEGMVGRVAWMPRGGGQWTETQDFVVFPGCNRMTLDMVTDPPGGIHDEATALVTGWRGMRPGSLRFDLNEDRGPRYFTLREVRLADDAAFSDTYPITFIDDAGAGGVTADIFVTTRRGQFDGTLVADDLAVSGGVNTFTWDGRSALGAQLPNATYWVYVVLRNSNGVAVHTSTGPVRLERPVASTPSWFVPLNPARLLDTRDGTGGNITPLDSQVFTELPVTGVGGVPDTGVPDTGVTAVVLNVTAVLPTQPGFLAVWPSGDPQPGVSNLNFVAGQVVPNLVTVKVGANGRVNILNSQGRTDVVADVVGYYTDTAPPSGGRFTSLNPARLLDTREPTDPLFGAVAGGGSIDLAVTGVGGVPASGVSAVALNVTVDQPTAPGYITVWPTGAQRPTASTHNFTPGLTVANLVLAKVGDGGKVSLFNSNGATHLVADVVGYFSSTGGRFIPISPSRVVNTRDGTGDRLGPLGANGSFTPVVSGGSGAVVNVTSVNASTTGYITAWPAGETMPLVSTLNPRPGVPVPNQAYLKLSADGRLGVYNFAGSSDVVIDVFGYFE